MQLKTYGTAALSEFLGDNVAYRNLVPADPRLPPVAELCAALGLESGAWVAQCRAEKCADVLSHAGQGPPSRW